MLVTSNKSGESREILKQGIHIFQLDKYIEKGNEEVKLTSDVHFRDNFN